MSPGPAADVDRVVPEIVEIHRRLLRRGTPTSSEVYGALRDAWRSGGRAEAESRLEGRLAAALEVVALVDELGQQPERLNKDEAHFAGLAAEIYFAGTPLRRRLLMVWRLLRPRWVGELAWRRTRRKGQR